MVDDLFDGGFKSQRITLMRRNCRCFLSRRVPVVFFFFAVGSAGKGKEIIDLPPLDFSSCAFVFFHILVESSLGSFTSTSH